MSVHLKGCDVIRSFLESCWRQAAFAAAFHQTPRTIWKDKKGHLWPMFKENRGLICFFVPSAFLICLILFGEDSVLSSMSSLRSELTFQKDWKPKKAVKFSLLEQPTDLTPSNGNSFSLFKSQCCHFNFNTLPAAVSKLPVLGLLV